VHFAVVSSMKFVLWVPTGKFYSSRQVCHHEFSSFVFIKFKDIRTQKKIRWMGRSLEENFAVAVDVARKWSGLC